MHCTRQVILSVAGFLDTSVFLSFPTQTYYSFAPTSKFPSLIQLVCDILLWLYTVYKLHEPKLISNMRIAKGFAVLKLITFLTSIFCLKDAIKIVKEQHFTS